MNFFEQQDKARKKTFWLVLYFLLAIFFIILAIDLVVVGAIIYTNPAPYVKVTNFGYLLNHEAVFNLVIMTALAVSPVIVFIIILGTILKIFALSGGGVSVANMVNATPISPNTTDFLEKRFVNIVEEMSIAAGTPVPQLFVMENEPAINAFVAGYKPEDTVMVVTKGALTQLSRDELQGVVGHEFSHVYNGDMHINLKLMGILGGLLMIGQAGYFLLRFFGNSNSRSSSDRTDGRIAIAVIIIGIGLLVIGYIGLFFGRLIKAAVSRERELLADASSVQYTRNPQGIIFALKRIQKSEKGTNLNTKNVEDVSHLCFGSARWVMFNNLLATHPPLDKRIEILDPQGEFANVPLKDLKDDLKSTTEKKSPQTSLNTLGMIGGATVLAGTGMVQTSVSNIQSSIGKPTNDNVMVAQKLLAHIPDSVKDVSHDPAKVENIYYALVLSELEDKTEKIIQILQKEIASDDLKQVLDLGKLFMNLPKAAQLPLIDISMPAFKSNTQEKRASIVQTVQKIMAVGEKKLFEFTLLSLLQKSMQDKIPKDSKVKYNDFKPVLTEVSLLIIAVLKVTTQDESKQNSEFVRLMKNFTDNNIERPAIGSAQPIKFQEVLSTLNQLAPLCKEKLINTLLDAISEDGVINLSEAELVRAIAANLDCPIPPIVATE